MKNWDKIILAVGGAFLAWKVGQGLGLGIQNLGTGLGEGAANIGGGFLGLGSGLGLGAAYTGAGVYQVGTGIGTLAGGTAPANIIQAAKNSPDAPYYALPGAAPTGTATIAAAAQAQTPTAATAAAPKAATAAAPKIAQKKSTWQLLFEAPYLAISSYFFGTKTNVTANSNVNISQPVAAIAKIEQKTTTSGSSKQKTTTSGSSSSSGGSVYNPTLKRNISVPTGATPELRKAMASPSWNPSYK